MNYLIKRFLMPARVSDHHVRPIGVARHHVRGFPLLAFWDIRFIWQSDFGSRPKWEVNRLPAFDLLIGRVSRNVVAGDRAEAAIYGRRTQATLVGRLRLLAAERLLASSLARAQHVQAQPRYGRGQPSTQGVDVASAGAG